MRKLQKNSTAAQKVVLSEGLAIGIKNPVIISFHSQVRSKCLVANTVATHTTQQYDIFGHFRCIILLFEYLLT